MRQKGLPAEVFDKIENYQRFIATHSLIAAEWNIIRGINSGENNIESYFRQNATSRKLIENQFVKIVEDMEALNKGDKTNDESSLLADTLIEIRSRLNEYLKLKGHITEFERIKEYYAEFSRKNDELLQAFQGYETYKLQAAAIRRLIASKRIVLEQEKTAALNKRDYNTKSRDEGKDLQKLLEAGLINYQKARLDITSQRLQEDRTQLAHRQAELERQLDQFLTLEGYGEYRTDKEQLQEIEKRLQTLKAGQSSLQDDYQIAGSRLRFLIDRLFTELEAAHKNAMTAKGELAVELKKTQQALITEEKKAAVLANAIESLMQNETGLVGKQREINNFFLERGETDALLFADQVLREMEEELTGFIREADEIKRKIEVLDSKVRSLEQESIKNEGEIDKLRTIKEQDEKWLRAYQKEMSGLEQKAAQFGKGTLAEYYRELEFLLYRERLNKLEKEIEAGRLHQKKQLSEARGYYVPNEEILALAEKLGAKCEFVQAGIDWLAQANAKEKELLVRRLPYLPFSVLVDRLSFEKLKTGRLKLEFSSDYPVPVVNIETVRLTEITETEDIYYICSFTDMVLNHNHYKQYLQSLEALLTNTGSQIAAMEETIQTLDAALTEVSHFYARYPLERLEYTQHQVETRNREIAALSKRQQDILAESSRIAKDKTCLCGRAEELSKLAVECREKTDKLMAAIQIGKDLAGIREQLRKKQSELEAANKNIAGIQADAEESERQCDSIEKQIEQLIGEKNDIKKEKEQLISFAAVVNELSLTQARAEFKALHEAVSGIMTEENGLRSRANEYTRRLNGLKARIKRDYGGDLEEIESNELNGARVSIPSPIQIETVKQVKKENFIKLSSAEAQLQQIHLEIKSLEGKLEEILKGFPSDAKTDLPVYDSETHYREELETVEKLITSYEQAIIKADGELEEINKQLNRLDNQAESYDAFIEREEVAGDGTIAPEIKDFRLFEGEYYQLRKNVQSQCEKWDNRMKTIREEAADFVIREPLEELANIGRPGSAGECFTRQKSFAEYIANIEEQMRKISGDIVQLESYQQDFTRRCVQRAELVLGHLRKLESLSRIEVYGRRINMIELKLPEFEEKEKALRMKAHINAIVREIGEEGVIDRKRIISKLSVKELLAQITDLDKAAVRLYKIESIPENSRYYRWENAIGSEGQNNSLYFIFAACLISFIRMLSITNSAVRTKKVIIADNPFGATSAVYLWDPMFKILKQNDVQLIAPGHRIPREITSRFGVSYLLNQDILEDGRRRVVVKDVRVEEDEDMLTYLEPEQLAIFPQ